MKCVLHKAGLIGKRCEMAMQLLPAACLGSIPGLPAARALVRASNHLIGMALWSIGQAILRIEEKFLPALREGRAAGQQPTSRNSAVNALSPATTGKPMTSRRCDRPGPAKRAILPAQALRNGVPRGREEDRGILSRAPLWPDAPDIVRDIGDHLFDAAARPGQHRRHPVR